MTMSRWENNKGGDELSPSPSWDTRHATERPAKDTADQPIHIIILGKKNGYWRRKVDMIKQQPEELKIIADICSVVNIIIIGLQAQVRGRKTVAAAPPQNY